MIITTMMDGRQWYWSSIATWTTVKADARIYTTVKDARQSIRRCGLKNAKLIDA